MALPEKTEARLRRRRKLIRWSVRALLVYTILGFFVLPMVVRRVAVKQLAKALDREVTIRSVRINPYAFSCSVRGLLIKDPDGEPFVSWDEVYVNFQLSSFLGRPWVFKEVSATNIYLRAQINKDRSFNFSDLLRKFAQESHPDKPPEPSKPPALRIGRLSIGNARAAVTDLTPSHPFHRVLGPLKITLNDFRTDPDSKNPYAFNGSTDAGEQFAWSGHFSLNPIRAEGQLLVENIALNKYAPLYQDVVRFEIQDGIASFGGAYRFVSSPATNIIQLSNAHLALQSFKLAEPGSNTSLVELPAFVVSDVNADLVSRRLEVGSLSVTGAVLNLRRSRDASINVMEMAQPSATATNAPGGVVMLLRAVTNAFSLLLSSTNAATASLRQLSVENCAVTLEDEVNSRPVQLNLDQIRVTGKNLSNLPGTNLTADLSLRWNTNGAINAELTAALEPLSADLHLRLDQLELRPLDPYLEPYLFLFITGSRLGMDGQIRLRTEPGQLPTVTFNGGYHLDDFATMDGSLGEDLLKWKSLRFDGMEANLNPPTVSIAKIELDDACLRLAVSSNHVVNLVAALHPVNTNAPVAEATAASDEPPATRKKALSQVKEVMSRTNQLSLTRAGSLSVGSVVISNAQLQLIDHSLTPHVEASLHEFNGTITDISSDELRHAQVHIKGKVDRAGEIEITGQLNPLHQEAASEIQVVLTDVDLNPGDPYMEKFLGYRLRKGKLSVQVSYQVTARRLKGKNLIQLDQLTLGEKVDSPDATKLPVKLGIAILKDRSGKIELEVPVEGDLDDPKFRLGPVIWHAFANVFTKIITSPFAALGALFGGKGEEVSYQDFDPGSATLLPPAKEKLDALGKALYERPGLEVEIEGNVDPVADRDGLRRVKLEQQLRARKWSSLRKSEQAVTTVQQVVLTPDERTRYLAEMLKRLRAQKNNPVSAADARSQTIAAGPPEKGAQALMQGLFTPEERQQFMSDSERELLASIPVDEADLQDLATERAKQVQHYLIETVKVEAERVYLTRASHGTHGHRVYLHLQ